MKERNVVIETMARTMIPFIQLYGFYVMAGTEGAGGGFQGGVILAASFILYALAFGLDKGKRSFPEKWSIFFKSLGLYFYAGIGILCVIFSLGVAEYLNYSAVILNRIMPHQEVRGLMIADVVEIGIGMAVTACFVSLFFNLVGGSGNGDN